MATCIIFCAGEFDNLAEPICADDFIIAADGGLRHCRKLGLTPHLILGDFDSLGYTPENATVFPVEKDDTDAMLAVRAGLKKGCGQFVLYGALDGPRLDHTVANLQTLLFLAKQGATGKLIGKHQVATLLRNGSMQFPAPGTGTVSIFAADGPAEGVTLKGLKYPLTDGVLTPDFPLGVSNRFLGGKAEIAVKKGSVFIIYTL